MIGASRAAFRWSVGLRGGLEDEPFQAFLSLGPSAGPGGVEIDLDLTHREIAEMVAAHRPTVSAVLKGLAEEGLVVREGRRWVVRGLDEVPAPY